MSGVQGTGNSQGLWRTLILVGVVGVAIGLIGHVLILGLLAPPIVFAGLIGQAVSRRKQR
ncbi:hypothetical protein AB0E10_44205 [Streptomyces sp. NPDC048045]|uniref:hypothetical protein n=1 Tax=Streptomyces sp. NPDC048045 TaxID=3154710 RepID=UPI003420C993